MRLFLSGNEDVCRWHLPVAQAKALSFVERCEKAGLTQNTFHFRFEETGATMQAQYAFGQLSLQMHAPFIPVEEDPVKEEEGLEFGPKTFWVNTTQGYFWVEVRYGEDELPVVILTPFAAKKPTENGIGEEFIYPGMGMQSFGMLAGCIGNIPSQRYVLTQSGGVMIGDGEEKGTIKLPGTGGGNARITVDQNDNAGGFFCVFENVGGKVAQVKVISVDLLADELAVEMKHGVIDMLVEAEAGNITSENFPKTPTYIHRKCAGSYFSPNKTIGYHVDAGSDDAYHGNTFTIPPGTQDKLDTGADGEFYFNHTKDLYGIASLFAAPLSFDTTKAELILVSPTLVWSVSTYDDLCWGGYGQTQSAAGCIDMQVDFPVNIISPRFCQVTLTFSSQMVTAIDLSGIASTNSHNTELELDSWCGTFGATAVSKAETQCGPKYSYEKVEEDDIAEPCSYTEDGTGVCDQQQGTTYEVEFAKEYSYRQHWVKNFKENITIKRKAEFRFGKRSLLSSRDQGYVNPYFLFDGLWHLDFGVMYLTQPSIGATCRLCAMPPWSQDPEELVYFMYSGSDDNEWILNHGHEYVVNLEIVEPLGIYIMPDMSLDGYGEYLGFIARVPKNLEAPAPPEVLTGGVSYPSEDVEGEIVNCEYSLMSAPCICDTPPVWGEFSSELSLLGTVPMYFSGGCPPFSWTGHNVQFVDYYGVKITREVLKKTNSLYVKSTSECSGSVKVYDVCGESLSKEKSIIGHLGSVVGPATLEPGETATYYHDLGPDTTYDGTLDATPFENELGNGAICTMPGNAQAGVAYKVSFKGPCNSSAEMTVITEYVCSYDVPNSGLGNPTGQYIRLGNACGMASATVVDYCNLVPDGIPDCTAAGFPEESWYTRTYLAGQLIWVHRRTDTNPRNCSFGTRCYETYYAITDWTVIE